MTYGGKTSLAKDIVQNVASNKSIKLKLTREQYRVVNNPETT